MDFEKRIIIFGFCRSIKVINLHGIIVSNTIYKCYLKNFTAISIGDIHQVLCYTGTTINHSPGQRGPTIL